MQTGRFTIDEYNNCVDEGVEEGVRDGNHAIDARTTSQQEKLGGIETENRSESQI